MYSQRAENIKRYSFSLGGPDIEFQIDEERGLPFIGGGRRPDGDGGNDDNNDSSPRMAFNNPNIEISVQFKNKIKNNNYELDNGCYIIFFNIYVILCRLLLCIL